MPEEHIVKHVYPEADERIRIKLTKNSKGYGWEISVGGRDGDEATAILCDVEERIRSEYGSPDDSP